MHYILNRLSDNDDDNKPIQNLFSLDIVCCTSFIVNTTSLVTCSYQQNSNSELVSK